MGWISSVVSAVSSAVSKAWSAVKSVASSVGNFVSGVVSGVGGAVSNIGSSVGNYVSSKIKKVSESVSKTISSISSSMNEYFSPTTGKFYDLKTQGTEANEAKRYDEGTRTFREQWEKLKESINQKMFGQAAIDFVGLLFAPVADGLKMGTVPIGPAGGLEKMFSPSGNLVLSKYIAPTEAAAKTGAIAKLFGFMKGIISSKTLKIAGMGLLTIFAATEIPNLINMTTFARKWKAEQLGESLTGTSIMMGKLENQFEQLGYAFRDALKENDKATTEQVYKSMESLIVEYVNLINAKSEVLKNAGEYDLAISLADSFSTILGKMKTDMLNMGMTVKEAYPEFFTGEKAKACPQAGETSAKDISYNLDQLHDFFGDLEWGIKTAMEAKNYDAAARVIENMNTIKGAYDKILNDFKSVLQTAKIYDGKKAISDVMAGIIKRYEEQIPVPPEELDEEITMTIREVVDGDTVRSHYKGFTYDIRLVGINSPELAHTVEGAYRSAEMGAKESKDWLTGMIWGQDVTVKIDPLNAVDKYGRVLGTIFLGGINVNLESVKQGWSMYYPYDVNKYVDGLIYDAADKAAKANKLGVWGLIKGVGKVNITSSPNYAEIYIDDVDTMLLTSHTFNDITIGKHTFYVIKYEWISETVELDIEAGKEYDVRFEK